MTLKSYLLVMAGLTAACWGIFLFVAKMVDPTMTSWIGFGLFYLSLFLALSGTAALCGFFVRFVVIKEELAFNLVRLAFRQSFMFALFIILLLILKAHNLFTLINLFLLVAAFAILELFLISYKKSR